MSQEPQPDRSLEELGREMLGVIRETRAQRTRLVGLAGLAIVIAGFLAGVLVGGILGLVLGR